MTEAPLTTVDEVKTAVIEAFGRDWLFAAICTGGWQEEMSISGGGILYQGPREPVPTGNLILELENGSKITIDSRRKGVRIHVRPHWSSSWTTPGQMRFNPRRSTIRYAVSAMRSEEVVEDFDLLKV